MSGGEHGGPVAAPLPGPEPSSPGRRWARCGPCLRVPGCGERPCPGPLFLHRQRLTEPSGGARNRQRPRREGLAQPRSTGPGPGAWEGCLARGGPG